MIQIRKTEYADRARTTRPFTLQSGPLRSKSQRAGQHIKSLPGRGVGLVRILLTFLLDFQNLYPDQKHRLLSFSSIILTVSTLDNHISSSFHKNLFRAMPLSPLLHLPGGKKCPDVGSATPGGVTMRYGAFYFLYYLCLSSGQGTCQADMNELGLIMNFIFCCQKTDLM